ncbi:MAG: serine--tRNA ligase [Sneathiellaceae bacterium]
MLDIKWIRDDPAALDRGRAARGLDPVAAEILRLDAERRDVQTRLQDLQAARNAASKQIGAAMKAGDAGRADALKAEVGQAKDEIQSAEQREKELGAALQALLETQPNIPFDDVPEGRDEQDNVEIRRHGTPPRFDFAAKDHVALGEGLGGMDFDTAARLSGARFVVLSGALARLERALAQFMLDLHSGEHGYTEVVPPYLVRDDAAYGTGQLPKFSEDLFRTTNGFWLIPTAEMPLTNLVRERILEEAELPLRFTADTPCFRSEAGAAGKDTRGMIRQHQFRKVEMVSLTRPEESAAELERMLGCAETVLQRLELPYRVMLLCAGDMGAAARKTYDIEVWLPGQERYREISSCSNCGDFQARRMAARYRPAGEGRQTAFLHSLNGSGLAVGRAMVAVLENGQEADGGIRLPAALHPYMGGLQRLAPAAA